MTFIDHRRCGCRALHHQLGDRPVLDFITPPDFEGENSAIGNDDIYDVTVQVSDGRGGVDTANLFVNVTDVPEGGTSPDGAVDGEELQPRS